MTDLAYHLDRLRESTERYHEDTRTLIADVMTGNQELWNDLAALRDELHEAVEGLGNRIEAATRRDAA